ncbi:MAG: ABC-F family ATP-binding cassette domain-containing protein [Chloroflexi bacterium]|nr:ABC-F family ATP-binding cassette domain-containing protein [Chloroflexota bacterium]
MPAAPIPSTKSLRLVFKTLQAEEQQLRALEEAMAAAPTEEALAEYSHRQERFEQAGGYDYELRIKQVLSGLGFDEQSWQMPLPHLSGGQRTRVLLGRLLLEKPDLLILDEPTNHLDVAAIEWLEGALKVWDGAVLLVSHDRYFLDRTVNTIWEMSRDGIEVYRGNYTAYTQQRQARWERRQIEFDDLIARLEKELDYIRRNIAGQRTQMAQGKLSRLSREVAAVHAGGLGVLADLNSKGWMQVKEAVNLGVVASTVGELHEQIKSLRPPSRMPQVHMTLTASHRSGELVLRTHDLVVGYPETPLFSTDDIELRRQECAALIGANGSGKTTFLKTILAQLEPLAGYIKLGASLDVGYFSQAHEGLNPDNTVLDELLSHQEMRLSEARNYLARYLFRGDDVYKKVSSLSGGERGRLALAILALQKANFLLLDEPTNHLDIPAQETLQAALEQFSGTILMVTHDRYLVDRLATQIWELDDGRLHVHEGDYQEYLAWREGVTAVLKEEAAQTRAEAKQEALIGQNGSGLSKNEQRKKAEALGALEAEIHEREATLATLSKAMEAATQTDAVDKIQAISIEYAATEAAIEALMEKWETMAHE